jgi:hypothetical protein
MKGKKYEYMNVKTGEMEIQTVRDQTSGCKNQINTKFQFKMFKTVETFECSNFEKLRFI